MPGHEVERTGPPVMIAGEPWPGCPGGLAHYPLPAQARRMVWHTEGRLGPAVSSANPALVSAVEAFTSGQRAAQTAQHDAEMKRIEARHGV